MTTDVFCEVCNRRFVDEKSLNAHFKKDHTGKDEKVNIENVKPEPALHRWHGVFYRHAASKIWMHCGPYRSKEECELSWSQFRQNNIYSNDIADIRLFEVVLPEPSTMKLQEEKQSGS